MNRFFEISKDLFHGSAEDRMNVARSLGCVSNSERDEAIQTLQRALASEDSPGVREVLVSALDSLKDTSSLIANRYRSIRVLGQGGFSRVFLAYDPVLKREVAIKELAQEYLSDGHTLELFENDARIIARLDHPNIVAIHDLIDRRFIVMEYLPGGSVRDRMRRTRCPLPLADAIYITLGVLAALEVAHSYGIIHRDIKPDNVLFRGLSEAKLSDFGLAYLPSASSRVTGSTGILVETLAHMSPEQIRGEQLDARSDLYSTGALLFEMLAGDIYLLPEHRTTLISIAAGVQQDNPRRIGSLFGSLPRGVDRVIVSLMQKDREKRPSSARDVLGLITDLLGNWVRKR